MQPPEPILTRENLRLWLAAAGRLIAKQGGVEGFGAPGYGLTLALPKPTGFAAAPRDFRPVDAAFGRAVLAGRFVLAGAQQDIPHGQTPWDRPNPSRRFAVELHQFLWLPHLLAASEGGGREALRLVLRWREVFGAWTPFAWGREVMSRRVFNLACAARRLASAASGEVDPTLASDVLADLLARQARHLLRLPDDRAWAAEHAVAAAVAGAALDGVAGERLLARALPRLARALGRTVLPDGCHASRSPESGMELLLDLLTLDDALLQRGREAPPEISRAIDRLTAALRALTLGDGRLACAQGGEPSTADRVAAARAHDDEAGEAVDVLPDGLYHRLKGQMLLCVLDAGAPAAGVYGVSACAQPLAVEIVCGRDRLITNSGWSERAPDRQGFRLTGAGSTLSLGESSVAEPLQGRLAAILGPRLRGPDLHLTVERNDGDGLTWVEAQHDGWTHQFGLLHQRRLYVDGRVDELRAEDRLYPAPGARPRSLAAPYAVRFHLEPGVQASLSRDKKSALLRGASGRGWWFRTDVTDLAVEPSVQFKDGVPRKTLQLVLRGVARTDAETKVRWKLTPAGASETVLG